MKKYWLLVLTGFQISYGLSFNSLTSIALGGSFGALCAHHEQQRQASQHYYAHKPKMVLTDDAQVTGPLVKLCCHGLGGYADSSYRYQLTYGAEVVSVHAVDFPSSRKKGLPAFLAQKGNIQALINAYTTLVQQGYPVIMQGVSDGAASIITTMGSYDVNNVKALILESPYTDVQDAIQQLLKQVYLGWVPGLAAASTLLVSNLKHTNFSTYGIRPLDVVHKINKNIPILFVCVENDPLTPASGTIALYNRLKEVGHTKVHLLMLKRGNHGFLLSGPEGHIYRATTHAFLRHYGLPHNQQWAHICNHPDFITA